MSGGYIKSGSMIFRQTGMFARHCECLGAHYLLSSAMITCRLPTSAASHMEGITYGTSLFFRFPGGEYVIKPGFYATEPTFKATLQRFVRKEGQPPRLCAASGAVNTRLDSTGAMSTVTPMNGKANGFHDQNGHEDIEAPGMRHAVSTGALEKMGMSITFQVRSLLRTPAPT